MRSIAIALSSMLVLAPIPSQAASVACEYMLLRVYHAEMDHCRVALPKDREDRYSRMDAAMEKYIRDNARNDASKMISSVDDNVKRAVQSLTSCKSSDFDLARQAMDQLTTPANESGMHDRLKYPGDPQVGGCGT